MNFLAIAAGAASIVRYLPFVLKVMKSLFGPDWSKKKDQIKEASAKLDQAQSLEEQDAALKEISKSFNSAP